MRGRNIRATLEFNGRRLDESVLTCLTSGDVERWSIDIPTVLRILDLVAAGDVSPRATQDALRRATSWDSGCCGECDDAAPHYAEARHRHADAVQRWKQTRRRLDPDEYPYLLNKGKLHRLSCQRPPRPMPPPFPDDLHSFAILFDGCGGNLDSVFGALDERSVRGAAQISVADVLGMVAREGETAIRAKLCRACKPVLPSLDPSHPATQPACWSWAIGPAVFDQQRASAAEWPSKGASTLPEQRVAYAILGRWHDGRCAICGQMPAPGGLVRDHDHATGLMRGLLCSFCNKTEGRSNSLLFDNYRRRPPSVILDVEVLYLPPGFRSGIRHTVLMAQ